MSSASAIAARRAPAMGATLVLVAAVAVVYWPGIHGFWGRDDFMQLAFSRMIGSPWPLFVHDHFFPAPGSVFRPLGFASMWLCAALLGTSYEANAIADLALHAGVGLALLAVLRRAAIPWPIALVSTMIFALHPAVIGTALWWSARFDLLATLFILLGLLCAIEYRARPRASMLACALGASLAAMLSKEIGLVAVPVLSWVWLRWAWAEEPQRRRAMLALTSIVLVAVAWLVWRALVLGTATTGLAGSTPLHGLIVGGVQDWLHQAPGYWSFWVRLDAIERITLTTGLVAAIAGMAVARTSSTHRARIAGVTDVVICGLCLLVMPALLQSPVAALNAMPLSAGASAVETAMQSRLHYLGVAGLAMLIAALLTSTLSDARRAVRIATLAGMLLGAMTMGAVSRGTAQAFAQRSVAISAVARDAVAAVANIPLPETRCHVVFLGFEPAPEWSRYVSMDSIVKALSPDLTRIGRCYFHSDVVTYFHLMAPPVDVADAAPYRPLELAGTPLPWPRIGDLTAAYLTPPQAGVTVDLAQMKFFSYRDGRFEDVSDDVAAGRLVMHLE